MKTRQELVEVMATEYCHGRFDCELSELAAWQLEYCLLQGRYILEALEAAGARVVPEVATERMADAAYQAFRDCAGIGDAGGTEYDTSRETFAVVAEAAADASPFKGE